MNRTHLFGAVILLIFTTQAHSALVMYSVGKGSGTVIGTTIDHQSSRDSVFKRDSGQRRSFQLNSVVAVFIIRRIKCIAIEEINSRS